MPKNELPRYESYGSPLSWIEKIPSVLATGQPEGEDWAIGQSTEKEE